MHHARYIVPGLLVFVGILTLPIWLNLGRPAYRYPEVVLPAGAVELNGEERTGCVEPGEWMTANHMTLLTDWRDSALRESRRVYAAGDGRKWETSLQNTCMACHANKAEFCDKCHDTNSVNPYCWDCHIIPQGNNHAFE